MISQVSVYVPHVAVIVALPVAFPVTLPFASTSAIVSSLDANVISPVAPFGANVAIKLIDSLTSRFASLGATPIPAGVIGSLCPHPVY